jgi:hypothetical protein
MLVISRFTLALAVAAVAEAFTALLSFPAVGAEVAAML